MIGPVTGLGLMTTETVRGAKPGLRTSLFAGTCLLIGALSSGVPPMPTPSVPNLTQMPENDPVGFDNSLVEFRTQAGLVDKTWILRELLLSST